MRGLLQFKHAAVAYAIHGAAAYKNPDSAGPTIIAPVQTVEYIATICGNPFSGAIIGAIERIAGETNARDAP